MDKLKHILLVVNPISGDSDKAFMVKKIKSILHKRIVLEQYTTCGKNDKQSISQIIEENNPARILVIGGDGTIKLVAEAIKNKEITMGVIPAGSANGLANDLGLPIDLEKNIKIALGENSKQLDCICINNQLGIHISDFGLNAELIKNYEESNFRGKFGYAINSISALYNSDMPYTFNIETEERTVQHQAIMVAIANSRKFGTGALVNPHGKIDDGKFEILIFKKFDVLEILKTLRGELEISADFVETIQTTKAIIRTEIPIDFQIDGEYCDALKEVKAEIIPKKIRIAIA